MRSLPLPYLTLCAGLLSLAGPAPAAVFFDGMVVNAHGFPVTGATVKLDGLADAPATTDSAGHFRLASGAQLGIGRAVRLGEGVEFHGRQVVLQGLSGHRVGLELLDALGRRQVLLAEGTVGQDRLVLDLSGARAPAPGFHVLRARLDGEALAARVMAAGDQILWSSPSLGGLLRSGLAKRAASRSLQVTASGYGPGAFPVDQDTAVGLSLTLYPQGAPAPAPVAVVESTETATFGVASPTGVFWSDWFNANYAASWNQPSMSTQTRTFKVIHLDNGLIRVTIAPELGMRVIRAVDKTAQPERQFFQITPFNRGTEDMGGVKPSYPFFEHSTGLFNDTAGYFISKQPDGSVEVAMNLRFDHHQSPADLGYKGRYGDRPLEGKVTVRPGSIEFSVSYISDNPNPLRRSNRIWNDAIWPSNPTEILFPFKWEMSHGGRLINDYTANGFPATFPSKSHFGLDPQYPFAGFWYQAANANHLRIADPAKAPGTKLFLGDPNILELWGSTNQLFEAPEAFVNAFEPVELKNSFFLARGIGKVTYANDQVAIASTADHKFSLITTAAGVADVYDLDASGTALAQGKPVGPTAPLSGSFTQGLRVVLDGKEVCKVALPLQLSGDSSGYGAISQRARASGAWGGDYGGPAGESITADKLNASRGLNFELEGAQNKNFMLNSISSLVAVKNVTASDDPDILISMANAAYRHGGFDVVEQYLALAGDRKPKEAAYLRALINLEKGQAADFSNTPVEGDYFKALQAVAGGKPADAIAALDELLAARPGAVRPRLLRAYLKRDIADALAVLRTLPASVEAWATLQELAYPGAADKVAALLKQGKLATVRRDDFLKEIKQGKWRHERRFEYADAMFVDNSKSHLPLNPPLLPGFPDFLRYPQ